MNEEIVKYLIATYDGDEIVVLLDSIKTLRGGREFTKTLIDYIRDYASGIEVITPQTTTMGIMPNKLYKWSGVPSLSISFGSAPAGVAAHYMFEFSCPSNAATQLALPQGIKWADDEELEPEAGMTYQVSILNGLAIYASWEN